MVANRAGMIATIAVHQGLDPRGEINHPRPDQVGLNSSGTDNFGVGIFAARSTNVIVKMAMMTAKSETKFLTLKKDLNCLVVTIGYL